jgi:hypothetical protein
MHSYRTWPAWTRRYGMPFPLRGPPLTSIQISGILPSLSCFLYRVIQLRACSMRSPVVAPSRQVSSNLLLGSPRTTTISTLSSLS